MKNMVETVVFDADDTLWENEHFFREAESQLAVILNKYNPVKDVTEILYQIEMEDLPYYGYGIKAFMLSMLRVAVSVAGKKLLPEDVESILQIGREMVDKPVVLIEGVKEVLEKLQEKKYPLVLATKGDILDQKRKLRKSGLAKFFQHVEVMSEKQVDDYRSMTQHLRTNPESILMIGNSMRSDILPVLKMGGYAAYVPSRILWDHEKVQGEIEHEKFIRLGKLEDILSYL